MKGDKSVRNIRCKIRLPLCVYFSSKNQIRTFKDRIQTLGKKILYEKINNNVG